jgi:Ca2+-binding EF-hand superfamily protein
MFELICLQVLRGVLSSCCDFCPFRSFKVVDVNCKGYVSASDLRRFLCKYSSSSMITDQDVEQIIRNYDRCGLGHITYSDWLTLVMPRECVKNFYHTSHSPYGCSALSGSVIVALTRLLETEISFAVAADVARRRLLCCWDFSLSCAFEWLDSFLQLGWLTPNSFMAAFGCEATPKCVAAAIARLDRNKDGAVSFTDFSEALTPMTPTCIPLSCRRPCSRPASPPQHCKHGGGPIVFCFRPWTSTVEDCDLYLSDCFQ